ncbi:hypothetical protein M231_02099 [Tremella mesenterica]|uniref:Skg3/CAF120-like PH-like domain-containing protein n=1 Tax=Tremella mesenterica TaxID=5217 RepID=A0A4Q1BRV0_TREME|nr:hypothetical protein M231_02099 [Tremella mesenterica]
MVKIYKPGKVAVILSGRHAGKKCVVIRQSDEGTKDRPYPHAIVAGIERYPLKVTRNMGKKRIAKRSKVKPFIKIINYSHLLPTRYMLELESLKGSVDKETFKEPSQREDSKKAIKKALEERYTRGQNQWSAMFKRRSHPPNVSPLAPPTPSTSRSPASTSPMHANGTIFPPSGTMAGPVYSGPGMERVMSTGTVGSNGDKSEKRRSGFFSMGRKDKKKNVERESNDRPRSDSFSTAERNLQPKPSSPLTQNPQATSKFHPYAMHQFPPPQQGHTPPPPDRMPQLPQPSNAPQGVRAASNPIPPAQGDFGGGAPQGLPKSQSMGFSRFPDSHPYRGQPQQVEDQSQNGGMPRTKSMPLVSPPSAKPGVSEPSKGPADSSLRRSTGTGQKNGFTNSPGRNELPAPRLADFEAIVQLIGAQPGKTYAASPPELEMILARTSAGGQPKQGPPGSQKNDWDAVWLQLSGISMSMWSMKETRAAAAKGEKVPPTYFNITDSSLELLAPLPPPPHRPNSHPHPNVFSLNTAGSNRLLFSCPSEKDQAKWAIGLRLAAWERSRLEEIYTGHLIKSGGREPPHELVRGRMEGWVRVRVMGGTEWKRLWLVLSMPYTESHEDDKKSRRRSFFGIGDKAEKEPIQEPNTGETMASFYPEPRTQKNKTTLTSVLTITNVTQAYAVFPERLEVMSQSNLMKVVGHIYGELVTVETRLRDSGWALIIPEPVAESSTASPLANMMRWVTGVHDVFGLYGRPQQYSWDRLDPKGLFFAYPEGPDRGRLFLEPEEASQTNFRTTILPQIRQSFIDISLRKLHLSSSVYEPEEDDESTPRPTGDYRLPPLSFTQPQPTHQQPREMPRALTPITEQTDATRQNSTRTQTTTRSQPLGSGDRKQSDAPSKQNSGSDKFRSPIDDDRLTPIIDSSDNVYAEEPEQEPNLEPTPTTVESQSGPTVWSQSSATPTPTGDAEPVETDVKGHLVPLSAFASQDNLQEVHSTSSETVRPSPPALAPIISEPQLLSPTPRKMSSSGELAHSGLRDEPAALYLMNMVEEPQEVTHTRDPSPGKQRPTVVTTFDKRSDTLGRKPSGARALPPKKKSSTSSTGKSLEAINDMSTSSPPLPNRLTPSPRKRGISNDLGEDVSAFVAFAEQPSPVKPLPKGKDAEKVKEEVKSSFAPSKAAAERRAKAVQQAVDQQQAMNVPGGGRRRTPAKKEEWSGSEDEDEDEESPVVQMKSTLPDHPQLPELPQFPLEGNGTVGRSPSMARALPPVPQYPPQVSNGDYLPSIASMTSLDRPQSRSPLPSRAYSPMPERPHSQSPAQSIYQPYPQQPLRQHTNHQLPPLPGPPPPAIKQTMWNANFSADHGMPAPAPSGKFVELEEPSVHLTKAFSPHGLLQAGIQDKEERSAKKQEELARETGSSLISVPSKPPPPATGLLGAVAQHERDRKNAGGLGATLTDREREKRMAEDRQREIEKLQRQQMEHMRQFGDYPQPGYGQMPSPMMGMNMNPMGMPMGFPGYNPYAQQQAMMAAQIAYQQAMLSMQSHSPSFPAASQNGDLLNSPDRPASVASFAPPSMRGSPAPGPGPVPGGYGYFPQGMYGYPGMMMSPMGMGMSPMATGMPNMPLPGLSPMGGMGMYGPGSNSPSVVGGFDWRQNQTLGQGMGMNMGETQSQDGRSRMQGMREEPAT